MKRRVHVAISVIVPIIVDCEPGWAEEIINGVRDDQIRDAIEGQPNEFEHRVIVDSETIEGS